MTRPIDFLGRLDHLSESCRIGGTLCTIESMSVRLVTATAEGATLSACTPDRPIAGGEA